MVADYYTHISQAPQKGDFVVAHTMFIPVEILYAMSLRPLHLEYTGYMLSLFTGSCNDMLDRAGEMGFAPEICSSHRLIAGVLDAGVFPAAGAVVCSNLQCDNAIKSGELTMEFNHCPGFYFDYPYNQSEGNQEFILREIKEMIAFLEDVSGHKLDWDKLATSINEMKKQHKLVRQIMGLCQKRPSPFQPQDFLKFLAVDYMFAGEAALTRYLEAFYQELSGLAAQGKGFAEPERFRLMGLMIPPWHFQREIDRVLQQHGAALVCYPNLCEWDEDLPLDPGRPLESVALKWARSPAMRMFGPLDQRALGPIRDSVARYKIDGALNFTHLGCRQMGPANRLFKDVLDEQDVPILGIDCDLVDRNVTSEDEVRAKLEQFFELLEDR